MDRPIQGSGLLGLVTDAAQLRAAHYRDQASLLRQMAEAESLMRLRGNLLNLAHKYAYHHRESSLAPVEAATEEMGRQTASGWQSGVADRASAQGRRPVPEHPHERSA